MIIETCPICGHDLIDIMFASNPPIPKKECWSCGWSWQGQPEEIVRVPFCDFSIQPDELLALNDYLNLGGAYTQPACDGCSNNPKNGGSGVCNCTLGSSKFTY